MIATALYLCVSVSVCIHSDIYACIHMQVHAANKLVHLIKCPDACSKLKYYAV